ncbi:DUF433 domain-containing protein [Candidatus Poribacteria bacterium]|nr:DUF433 domain-containing protein [Candidatus Poribacteria bacterium]
MNESFITINPHICHGKPCIKGTRILVSSILSQLAAGYDFEKIKKGYPELADQHILAAIDYARAVIEDEEIYSVITE